MGVDVAHLVLEALGDADDKVVDDGAHGPEGGDVLTAAVVDLQPDNVLLELREVDGDVAEVLDELACFSVLETSRSLSSTPLLHGDIVVRGYSERCIPRGPSTVTILDLMLTLTVDETPG